MTQVIDRRLSGKNKSAVNRQRFIRRFKAQIKRAVADAVSGRSIVDIDNGEKINIPAREMLAAGKHRPRSHVDTYRLAVFVMESDLALGVRAQPG